MTKFECLVVNFFDHALRASGQMHGFATAIVRRVFSSDPTVVFQPMKQRDQCWFFNSKMRSDFGLGQRPWRHRQTKKSAPFGLTQTHRLEPLVQFQPPGARHAVQKRPNRIDIGGHGSKFVSLLTNSNSEAVSMPRVRLPSQRGRVRCRRRVGGSLVSRDVDLVIDKLLIEDEVRVQSQAGRVSNLFRRQS